MAIAILGYPAALEIEGSGVPAVVVASVGDPVATGLVDGLARPGGNITGTVPGLQRTTPHPAPTSGM